MLIGCGCQCLDQVSESIVASEPSVDTPSSLAASNSSASVDVPPQYCGACINFPTRWRVDIPHSLFTFNSGIVPPPLGYPHFRNCTLTSPAKGYLLTAYTGPTVRNVINATHCQSWASAEKRINVAHLPCALAGPCDNDPLNRPRVQLEAWNLDDGQPGATTFFVLYYAWSYCVTAPGSPISDHYYFAYRWSWLVHRDTAPLYVSCVRRFFAGDTVAQTNWPTIAWGMPYLFATPPPPTLEVIPA